MVVPFDEPRLGPSSLRMVAGKPHFGAFKSPSDLWREWLFFSFGFCLRDLFLSEFLEHLLPFFFGGWRVFLSIGLGFQGCISGCSCGLYPVVTGV